MTLRIEVEVRPIARSKLIHLLEKIAETGSVTMAAKSVGMTYANAWNVLGAFGRNFREPLVRRLSRGGRGGEAHLTDAGQEVLRLLLSIVEKAEAAVKDDLADLSALLRSPSDSCSRAGDERS